MNRLLLSVFGVLLMLTGLSSVLAQESGWPRTLPLEQGMVTIYAPQVDKMSDGVIHFRAALAYRETAGSEPVFGAGWFESRVEIDASSRIVHPTGLKVTDTRFPAGTDDVQAELSAVLAQSSPAWNLDFSLDELEASLKSAEAESLAVEKLNTAPPRIIYRDHPALLISIDGEPVLREIEKSPLEAVINTPYTLDFDGRHYYLNAAREVWYRADRATGPYQFEASPPADIVAMVNDNEPAVVDEQEAEPVTAANAPEIVVSTEPAELIVTEGPAAFVPLVDDLLVLQNSDDDVFMHVSAQEFYIVLSGRWYRANSLAGPWTYQPADDLPPAFANIPRDSNQADARVYVAGTQEARDAVLDAQVPQTAAVARGEADIEIEYDGDPVYEPVDGTDLVYIKNTGSTVIQSDGWYYLVEDGVWYMSSTPNGPWQVSDHRPVQVDTILPTSPVYNVKYVRIYDSTPSVVYVGYTPGYVGSYVYHNTIFYGSGWYYSPWVSPYYYYPRYSTWGFGVSYNPWSGWGFGLSWGWGPFSVGYYSGGYWHRNHYWHHRHYSHWGPHGYRPRPRHHGNRHDGIRRDRYAHRDDGRGRNDNLYRDGAQRAVVANTRDKRQPSPGSRRERNNDGQYKTGRKRIQPVSSSDIRLKADLRDANFTASRSRLLADSGGNVYRKADRGPDRSEVSGRTRVNKSTMRKTQPTARASTRQTQARVADNQTRQRSTPAARASARQSQPRTRNDSISKSRDIVRQRSPSVVKAPARQSRPRSINNSARQRSHQAVSAPAQARNSSRPSPQPQSARNSGRDDPAPAHRSSQRSVQKSSGKRSGSAYSGGKRTGSSRSKQH